VSLDRGAREVRDLRVGDRDLVGETVCEAAESGSEDDGNFRAERRALADEGGCPLPLVEC
jgi:hypothetical protein